MTTERLRSAGEQDAIERGRQVMVRLDALDVDAILDAVNALAACYDRADFARTAEAANINPQALAHLDKCDIPYPCYFCLPETLVAQPALIFYYRNLAALTLAHLKALGLDSQRYEAGQAVPDQETTHALGRLFNGVVSKLVMQGKITPRTQLLRMMANLTD